MIISDVKRVAHKSTNEFFKFFVYDDQGTKVGEFEFSDSMTAKEWKNYLLNAVHHYEELQTRKASRQT